MKRTVPHLTKKYVDKWFENQLVYSLHKPVRHNFKRNRIIVKGVDEQWQADLCDLSSLSKYNNGQHFLLTCIDCFSKYAWVEPLKNKTGQSIESALRRIMKHRKPRRLQTDKGTEFLNRRVQEFLKKENIEFFTTNSEMKASIVERFNRTLKTRMYKYFTAKNTLRFVDVLEDLVAGYNNTKHRSIGMRPIDVSVKDEHVIRKKLYPKIAVRKKYKYSIGDFVRISKARRTFKKGYLPNWTEEIFRVRDRVQREQPVYFLKDFNNKPIEGLFYEKELQRVHEQEEYRIEKVLKRKRVKGKTLYFVKWKGWSDEFNSWIENLHRL